MKYLLSSLFTMLMLVSCVEPIHKAYTKVPPGIWRGVLILDNKPVVIDPKEEYVEKTDFFGELPFNFEIKYTTPEDFYVEFHNDTERIKVSDIVYGRDKATAKDTLEIHFKEYDTYLSAIYEDDRMEGRWHVNYKKNYSIPFKAIFGQAHRFTTLKKEPLADISGKWDVVFEPNSPNPYTAIGEFKQKGNLLTGTFMTETGDYRFLEGTVQDNKFSLSAFDGVHAFLFDGKIIENGSLVGSFRSGKHYTCTWEAKKNDSAKLANAFELTQSTIGNKPFDFTFKDLNGQDVSLSDNRFNDKLKLVKISGTWCPNCKDESMFLKEYIENNKAEDIEVIEVSFEHSKDEAKAIKRIKEAKKTMNLPFTVLYGGIASKDITTEKFPQITKVLSYPTLIFVDRNNKIYKVHTGFAGPATSGYEPFKKEFDKIINEMRNI